jgi:hypothetical protein
LAVWIGVDASVKRDSTAVVAVTFAGGRVRLWHRTFQPSPEDPLDFEATIEKTLLDLRRRFWVREIRYDPSSSGRCSKARHPLNSNTYQCCGGGDGTPTATKLRIVRLGADVCLAVALGDAGDEPDIDQSA